MPEVVQWCQSITLVLKRMHIANGDTAFEDLAEPKKDADGKRSPSPPPVSPPRMLSSPLDSTNFLNSPKFGGGFAFLTQHVSR